MLHNSWRRWIKAIGKTSTRRNLPRLHRQRLEQLETRQLLSGTGAISGTVFEDHNGDGMRGNDDNGAAGVSVFLDLNHNGSYESPREVYESSNVPVAIPEVGTITSDIRIIRPLSIGSEGGNIIDLDVNVELTHTFDGDLTLTLIGPNDIHVTLAANNGAGGDNFQVTTFDDEAELGINEGSAPFNGSFRPVDSLSAFDGLSVDGPWTLQINDGALGDQGTLLNWSISAITTKTPDAEPIALTDSEGNYHFAELASGSYSVGVISPRGFDVTQPADSHVQVVSVAGGSSAAVADFGLHELPGSLSGFVFVDGNGNGFRDFNEDGENGVTVELLDPLTEEVLRTTVTYTQEVQIDDYIVVHPGYYVFNDLPAGEYLVREVIPEGEEITAPPANSVPLVGDDPVIQAGSFEVVQPPVGTTEAPAALLPDLIVDPVHGLRDVYRDGDVIRFSQGTPNVGNGPLRIVGGEDNHDGTQNVYQRIYDDQGGFTERLAGLFEFHPEHNHIHFNEFAEYRLYAATPDADSDGVPEVGQQLRGGEKTSFCLIDVAQYQTTPPLPNADPDGSGLGCDTEQEISVGWEDIYGAGTPGQEVNVAGLEPGQYWLEAIVDPENHFTELDETNNYARILITLRDDNRSQLVTVHPGRETTVADFGNFRRFDITGTVFNDANPNGIRDEGEAAIAHRGVFIDLNGDGVLNNPVSGDGHFDGLAEEPWRLTDEDGHYSFEQLGRGTYDVRVAIEPTEFATTTPSIFVEPNGSVVDASFGVADLATTPMVTVDILQRSFDEATLVTLLIDELGFAAAPNQMTISLSETGDLIIHEETLLIRADGGEQVDPHTVRIAAADVTQLTFLTVNLNGGDDRLEIQSLPTLGNAPVIFMGDGNDTVIGSAASELIQGGNGADLLQGGDGDDTISGGTGNDIIDGGDGADALVGDEGDDELSGSAGNDTVSGGTGTNLVDGGLGDDQLFESSSSQIILKDSEITIGYEVILPVGQLPTDLPSGTVTISADRLLGPSGVDQVNVSLSNFIKSTSIGGELGEAINHHRGESPELGTLLEEPEFQTFFQSMLSTGLNFDEISTTSGLIPVPFETFGRSLLSGIESSALFISGAFFGGFIDASAYSNPAYIGGGDGNDLLIGGRNTDGISGRDGDDTIQGGPGVDVLDGGNGNDVLNGGGGGDILTGEEGDDVLDGVSGDDILLGGPGNDLLRGGTGHDVLQGDGGDDTQTGGQGNDFFAFSPLGDGESNYGSDVIQGDAGFDELDYQLPTAGRFVLQNGQAQPSYGGSINLVSVEDLSIHGTDGDDDIHVFPSAFRSVTVDAAGGNDFAAADGLVLGGPGNDFLYSYDGASTLVGGDGDDLFQGNAGNDSLVGGAGFDSIQEVLGGAYTIGVATATGLGSDSFVGIEKASIFGSTGADRFDASMAVIPVVLVGYEGNDTLIGGRSNDELFGGDGDDQINGGAGGDHISGDAGDDSLLGGAGNDHIFAEQGRDTLLGENGDDTLVGGDGDNNVRGGNGNDLLFGGLGRDTLTGDNGDDELNGNEGNDSLVGGNGNDVLFGHSGNDSLVGESGNDTLVGGDGKDALTPGSGDDLSYGEAGDDVLRLNVVTSLALSASGSNGDGSDFFETIERITIIGSGDANLIDTTGYSRSVTVNGGGGNDTILTGSAADLINGGDGDDSIDSGLGGDTVNGDAGTDSISATGDRNFTITDASFIGFDTDTLSSIDRVFLTGGDSANTLDATSFSGSAVLSGGAGNDTLLGGSGNDILNGGDGADVLKGRAGNDLINGGAGNDTLNGGAGNDTLNGDDGDDALSGFTGNDSISGGNGNDTLIGGTGNDSLQGNAGDDLLRGDAGADIVAGNAGNDSAIILGATADDTVNRQTTERLLGFIFIADWIDSI